MARMSPAALIRALRLCIITLYAVAMTFAAVLPSAAMTGSGMGAATTGERLPGGEIAYLCHGSTDTSGQPHAPGGDTSHACCDACLLASTPGLGAVAALVIPLPSGGLSSPLVPYSVRIAETRRMVPSSRGPPVEA